MTVRAGLATRAVHAGYASAGHHGAVAPPLYQTASFAAADTEQLEQINAGTQRGFVYSRIRNPSVLVAEQRLAALEQAESTVLFASGMAAIAGALSSLLVDGDALVSTPDLYGGTLRYFDELLPRQGVRVDWAKSLSTDDMKAQISDATKVIYVETPTNPLMRIADLQALAELARQAGALLVVDGTLGGPMNQRPLDHGASLVIHSVSKYLNGHGDVIGGAVVGARAVTRPVRTLQQASGAIMEPFGAWLLTRGMASYPLRMAQHNENAMAIARHLAGHPKVLRVHYCGLPDHPDHELAQRQMQGFGGLVSFEVENAAAARQMVDRCKLFTIGPGLGGIESLISQPANTSHHSVSPQVRHAMGISDQLIRLSVGIETVDDLIADLDQALEGV